MLVFRVLKLVRDPNAGDQEIEELIQRDVGLSVKLLRIVNSASVGGREIWSIGHALRLLGREQVGRWLTVLLVSDGASDGVRAELTQLALLRARMCELLAEEVGLRQARGPLFLSECCRCSTKLLGSRCSPSDSRATRGTATPEGILR